MLSNSWIDYPKLHRVNIKFWWDWITSTCHIWCRRFVMVFIDFERNQMVNEHGHDLITLLNAKIFKRIIIQWIQSIIHWKRLIRYLINSNNWRFLLWFVAWGIAMKFVASLHGMAVKNAMSAITSSFLLTFVISILRNISIRLPHTTTLTVKAILSTGSMTFEVVWELIFLFFSYWETKEKTLLIKGMRSNSNNCRLISA